MAISFRVTEHSRKPGTPIVEILLDGVVCAAVYPDGPKGVQVISAHLAAFRHDDGTGAYPPIPSVHLEFDPKPYSITGGRLERHNRQ